MILDHDQLVDSVNSERVQAAALRFLDTERYVQGILYPEAAPEE